MALRQRVFAGVLMAVASLAAAGHSYGELPVGFEENRGQTDPEAKYLARGPGFTLFLTAEGAVWRTGGGVITMRLAGGTRSPELRGVDAQPGRAHYFIGDDPRSWRTGVPVYSRVDFGEVYPRIGLVFYGNGRRLEYDFQVAPGADPAAIRLQFEGIESLRVARSGDLLLRTAGGVWRHHRPEARQGSRKVAAAFRIRGPREIGFRVGSYDRSQPLVIDPAFSYATYLGGSGDDRAYGVAVDSSGCAYLVGETGSADFPKAGAAQPGLNGYTDVFVTKLNAAGTALVYSTYLGGSGRDSGRGIALDSAGNAYLTGFTYSANFPITAGVVQPLRPGSAGAFAAKLSAAGSALTYSTYLGGGSTNYGSAIAVDSGGNAYVAGYTNSVNFPVTAGVLRGAFGGGYYDGFVTKLNSSATALVYSTYLGGSGGDTARGIAVDGSGAAYVTGHTESADFPVQSAFRAQKGGGSDAFVAKLNAGGTGLVYSTFLGGRGTDVGAAIALDSGGNAYVTGSTASTDFPVSAGAFQSSSRGSHDAFVSKLNAAGNALAYSTYLGGAAAEEGSAIAVTSSGQAYVGGYTGSVDFPSVAPLQAGFAGYFDAFVALVNETGTALGYSTLLGGAGDDRATGVAVDSAAAYVAGYFSQAGFPTTAGAYRTTPAGSFDAFAAKIVSGNSPPSASAAPTEGSGTSGMIQFIGTDPNGGGDVDAMFILVGPYLNPAYACYLVFAPRSRQIWLASDTATAWLEGPLIGQAGSVSNSQCSVQTGASSVSVSGNTAVLNLSVSFQQGFAGTLSVYLLVRDSGMLNSGWQRVGSWTVPTANLPPAASAAPTAGSGTSGVIQFIGTDPNGGTDVDAMYVLIGPYLSAVNACYLAYDPRSKQIWLASDAATVWLEGPLIGQAGSLGNSQCSVDTGVSSASVSGNTSMLNLSVSFKPGFGGTLRVYLLVRDRGMLTSGWQQAATWTVSTTNLPPAASAAPTVGSGTSGMIQFIGTDPNGGGDVDAMYLLIGRSLSPTDACYLGYDPLSRRVWLASDAATVWIEGPQIGQVGGVSNSQCTVDTGASSASVSGNTSVLNLSVSFKPGFGGTLNVYLLVRDRAMLNSGWQNVATWTVATP